MTENATTILLVRTLRNVAQELKKKYQQGNVDIRINIDEGTIEIIMDVKEEL